MPWPCNFENILSGIDITVCNVSTERADMGTHGKRFLHQFATVEAFLCRIAGVDSDDCMSSVFSFGTQNIEKRTPGGIHDGLREMVIFHHPIDVQIFHGYHLILLGIRLCHLEMEVSALPLDLEVRQSHRTSGFAPSLAALLAAGLQAFFASKNLLRATIETRVLYRLAFTIGQEGLESHIYADGRMFARGVLALGFDFTSDENVPMPIGTPYQMCGLRRTRKGPMEFDLDTASQLLWDEQMLAIGGKGKISLGLT